MFLKPIHILLLFVLIYSNDFVYAQTEQSRDTIAFYKNIEDYSKKNKLTKQIHRWIFREHKTNQNSTPTIDTINYEKYKGKIIRKIIFQSNDPFGYSINDSTKVPDKWYDKLGNDLHIKTKPWAIKNYLLFKVNQPLDPDRILESERILYSQKFIRRINIIPKEIESAPDSIDIIIRSLDSWSLIVKGQTKTKVGKVELNQRNFLGLGHQFTPAYQHNYNDKTNSYQIQYKVPSIRNTFIEAYVNYLKDFNNNKIRTIELKRDFISNYTKWVGGIKYEHFSKNDSIYNLNLERQNLDYKYDQYDTWAGYAFRILKNSEGNMHTHLIATTRFVSTNYSIVPDPKYDPYLFYNDTHLWLTSVGLSSRYFNKTEHIFYQGVAEYYQTGQSLFLTSGIEYRKQMQRFYIGAQIANGRNYYLGYIAPTLEIGTFFNSGKTEQSLIKFTLFYMSDIFSIGSWKFRQFVVPKVAIGNNRFNVWNDLASLGIREDGIVGLNDFKRGSKKLTVALQLQSYAPKSYLGFRFSPFLSANFGTIANSNSKLINSRVYSSFGLGVQISNDFLVFDNFQFSFIFAPVVPVKGDNVFNVNSFSNTDLRLPNFQISKPEIVKYF